MRTSATPQAFYFALRRHREVGWVAAGALLLFFLRFGYDYGTSDQDEFIPFLLHRLDPSLFTQDWFVMTQVSEFGIRSYFVTVLQSFTLFFPPWLAALLLFIITWLLMAAALYALGLALTRNRIASAATVVLALVMTPRWTLGGNDLTSAMLVPSNVAWCLALWGLVLFLHRRWLWAGLLLGLATWMQALVGLQMAGLLGLVLLIEAVRERQQENSRAVLVFSVAFVLSALPSLGPLIYQQLSADPQGATETPSLFYIMAVFRNPHHYLFDAYPLGSKLRFGLLVVLGVVGCGWLLRKQRVWHARLLVQLFGGIALLFLIGFLFTEGAPSLFIAKLQLFKTTVLAKVLLLVLISGAAVSLLPSQWNTTLDRLMTHRWLGPAATGVAYLLVFICIFLKVGPVYSEARPLARVGTPLEQVETWARTNTPTDAVFAIPPTWSSFRSHAQRAIVINFKSFPYRDALIYTWFDRLKTIAPAPLPAQPDPDLQTRLDSAFLHQPMADLHRTAMQYDAAFVVQDRVLDDARFAEVFRATPWIVYEVVSPSTEAE